MYPKTRTNAEFTRESIVRADVWYHAREWRDDWQPATLHVVSSLIAIVEDMNHETEARGRVA